MQLPCHTLLKYNLQINLAMQSEPFSLMWKNVSFLISIPDWLLVSLILVTSFCFWVHFFQFHVCIVSITHLFHDPYILIIFLFSCFQFTHFTINCKACSTFYFPFLRFIRSSWINFFHSPNSEFIVHCHFQLLHYDSVAYTWILCCLLRFFIMCYLF